MGSNPTPSAMSRNEKNATEVCSIFNIGSYAIKMRNKRRVGARPKPTWLCCEADALFDLEEQKPHHLLSSAFRA